MSELQPTPYINIGGELTVKKLVNRFYELMDNMPEAHEIRVMHEEDLSGTNQKLFEFLSGWLGGPQLYIEKYGHPHLRARHLPFKIDDQARDQWLMCMFQAMDDIDIPSKHQLMLKQNFTQLANHMRNQDTIASLN